MLKKSKRIRAFLADLAPMLPSNNKDKEVASYKISEVLSFLSLYRGGKSLAKFTESVDVAFRLNADPKHADQIVRGSCLLPHGNGKKPSVLVFALGSDAEYALKAGAAYAGGEELIARVAKGDLIPGKHFDRVIAVPAVMPKMASVAKLLGTKGMMPNLKSGTITTDLPAMLSEIFSGRLDFKIDKTGYIKLCIGKITFDENQIKDNLMAVYNGIKNARPAAIKANFFNEARLSVTMMGSSFKVKMTEFYNS